MAFLSAGHVPGEGRYGDTVEKGIRWVLKLQQPNGLIATEGGTGNVPPRHLHADAGRGGRHDRRQARRRDRASKLEKAVAVILQGPAQTEAARTTAAGATACSRQDSDMSVTGWQVMALRAAKNLGCDVPAESIDLAVAYHQALPGPSHRRLPLHARRSAHGPLHRHRHPRPWRSAARTSTTAPRPLRAGGYLLKNPPRWDGTAHFFYGIYYCSQATFQLGDNYWKDFRPKLHKVLLDHQSRNGPGSAAMAAAGSYGANYCTAMGVLALTVEYRFLPIYQRGEEPTDK